ncbi:MAG: PDCD5-related protein [Benniella sp.]|nr:MAG: PDCD5-related protein [Benniella sp.]
MDDDEDLKQLRARRLAELKAQSGGGGGGGSSSGGFPSGMGGSSKDEDERAQRSQMEEMRRTMLTQILDPQARERLSRVAMVKPEKARAVEDMLIQLAQSGRLQSKVNEDRVIDLLGQLSEQTQSKTKITFQRRGDYSDDDDDFDL